jgi:membrane fusion protein (multidrug efflux system)
MSKNRKRNILLLGVCVLLVALSLPKLLPFGGGGDTNNNASAGGARGQIMQVQVKIVHPETLRGEVTAVGTVLSNEEIEVRSQVSGQIQSIRFKEGGTVKKGDLLVKINDDELQAQLLRARSRQAIAEQNAERQKQLFEKEFVSQEEYNIVLNELNVMRAEAQLTRAQIDKSEIRAPFDGSIGLRFASEGSYISPSTIITTLQDNRRMKVDFTVPEKYAGEIKVGDKITFRVQTRTEQFEGTIAFLDSRLDQATRTLRVRALTPNPGGLLIPGSFATVEVRLNERKAMMVPAYALVPDLKGHRVFLYKDGKAISQSVEIGTRTEEQVEVVHGLQPGDTLITSAILQLRPGMAVTPIASEQTEVP